MEAEQISQQKPPGIDGVEIDAVGNALGYTQAESREIACQMRDEGLAVLSFAGPATLKLTVKGHEEIRKFRWPKWRRWVDKNLGVAVAITIATISLLWQILKEILR